MTRDQRSGWKRLEEMLGTIKPGETVTVETLAAECGLTSETVERMLMAAIEAELFERNDDGSFARRGLVETTLIESDGRAVIVDGVTRDEPKGASPRAKHTGKSAR